MKRINNWFGGRSIAASALCVVAGDVMAHAGHQVPAGVQAQHHWHLFGQVVISPGGLTAVGATVLVLAVWAINKQRRRARAD